MRDLTGRIVYKMATLTLILIDGRIQFDSIISFREIKRLLGGR
jgi:hypothetical protein